jgi:hypothetical protein
MQKRNGKNGKKPPPEEEAPPTADIMPTDLADEMAGLPSGAEGVSARDMMIPRLVVLQALSPQLQPNKPEYIPDAKVGQFCDVGTGEVFQQLVVLPCCFRHVFIEWFPRASGKGMAKHHGTDASVVKGVPRDEKNRWQLPNGNYVVETAEFYVLNMTANARRSMIPLSSTQWRAARKWLTNIMSERMKKSDGTEVPVPLWYRTWVAGTKQASNVEGNWFLWDFTPSLPIYKVDTVGRDLMRNAVEFTTQAAKGLLALAPPEEEEIIVDENAPM